MAQVAENFEFHGVRAINTPLVVHHSRPWFGDVMVQEAVPKVQPSTAIRNSTNY